MLLKKKEMTTLTIEWRHLDVDGQTCDLCSDTGATLVQEIQRLNRLLSGRGIRVELSETPLDSDRIDESNMILIDGAAIEQLVDLKVVSQHCASCTDLIGEETDCRTVVYDGQAFDDIPAKAIRDAVRAALGCDKSVIPDTSVGDSAGCCCQDKSCC